MPRTQNIFTATAQLPVGWANDVRIFIDNEDLISHVEADVGSLHEDLDLGSKSVLPASSNRPTARTRTRTRHRNARPTQQL